MDEEMLCLSLESSALSGAFPFWAPCGQMMGYFYLGWVVADSGLLPHLHVKYVIFGCATFSTEFVGPEVGCNASISGRNNKTVRIRKHTQMEQRKRQVLADQEPS